MDGKMKRRNFIKGLLALPVTLAVVDATLAAKAFFEPKPDYAKLMEKQAPITEWQANTAYNVGDRIMIGGNVRTVTYAGVSGNTPYLVGKLSGIDRIGVCGSMVSCTR
jgi:hypothetical protein